MTPANRHILHPTIPLRVDFLPVGHSGRHELEALHAADRLGSGRPACNAAYAGAQQAIKRKFARAQQVVVDAKSCLTRLLDPLGALHEAEGAPVPISALPLFCGNRPGLAAIQWERP